MEALEFLNIIHPEHDRTSCSDENIFNGYSHIGNPFRCKRCLFLQVINEHEDIKGVKISEIPFL